LKHFASYIFELFKPTQDLFSVSQCLSKFVLLFKKICLGANPLFERIFSRDSCIFFRTYLLEHFGMRLEQICSNGSLNCFENFVGANGFGA